MTTLVAASASSDAAPGALGFLVVFGLVVILVFVFRSMSKHIRKINEAARRDEEAGANAAGDEGGGPASGAGTAASTSPDRHTR